jgi:hypothetical protein
MCSRFTFSDVFRGCARPADIFFFGGISGGREIDGGNGVGEGVL